MKNEELVILENQSEQVFWMDELILLTFEFSKFQNLDALSFGCVGD